MTDEQIIQMLKRNSIYSCEECCDYTTAWCEGDGCNVRIAKYALDIIHKQQAEIEQLNTLAMVGMRRAKDYQVMRNKAITARTETIKEFAERLKQRFLIVDFAGITFDAVAVKAIDNLVKEMVGDE